MGRNNLNFSYSAKNRKKSKNKAMTSHLKIRFFKYYGKDLTDNMIDQMISSIKHNNSEHIFTESRSRTVHIVTIGNIKTAVVYNKEKHLIHTCFPVEWFKNDNFNNMIKRRNYINYDPYESWS